MQPEETRRILVIDNEEEMTRALAIRLLAEGYDCVTAETGVDGLREIGNREIHLVITDLNMPQLGGVGLIRVLRQHSAAPVIVVTDHAADYRPSLRGLRRVTVLSKPVDTETLLDMIDLEMSAV